MASGYFVTGITTGNLLKLVKRNGVGRHPKYIYRFAVLLLYSFGTSVLEFCERLFYGKKIQNALCPRDPVVIVGHWRSGTTFLHQIFNSLPAFKTPSMIETGMPGSFFISKKILSPILRMMLPPKRSTDNISLTLDEPQEDEFALFRATTFSPVERLVFPEKSDFFLNSRCDFMPPDALRHEWNKTLTIFCKKLSMQNKGRVVLKNPFHSTRIVYLKQLFPRAKFIHIYRNPTEVIPSTIRMWKIEGDRNALRKGCTTPTLDRAISIYDTILSTIKRDLQRLPAHDYCTIRFEDLEDRPVDTIRHALNSIGITLSGEHLRHLDRFITSLKHYKKNSYHLSKEQRDRIRFRLKHHIPRKQQPSVS
ncbi:MAG: sulfotransferase [Chitinispirillaceae bacterium]|nr:sulfotransferase [Chitinispirillaceae bacterium]